MNSRFLLLALMIFWRAALSLPAADSTLHLQSNGQSGLLQVEGDTEDEWRFQTSGDLTTWTNAPTIGTVFSGPSNLQSVSLSLTNTTHGFVRAVKTTGLFDLNVLRTVNLTFDRSNWATLLTQGRMTGSNTASTLVLDNGITVSNVGARYKGNTSFTIGGNKKSVNLDINWIDPEAHLLGYRAVNLNNAAGDETIMREPVYFQVMSQYAPSPHGAMAKLNINGAYWGVYSMVDQLNNDLLDEWFPSHDGDRWRAPNVGGGGGGFQSSASAFAFLGTNVSSYTRNYELKSDNSTNAWQRLVQAITVLNTTPTNQLRDKVEEVFAVDRWLWFLAVENIFVDDDSYWNKGADYAFYYEPESGRIHPVEHDGNEAFASIMGATHTLSPVQGATGNNRPLLNKLLSINELRQRYLAHMRTVIAERFNPAYMTPLIDHFHYLTVADISIDPKKNFTMAAYSNDLRVLRTYLTNRYSFLTNHAELRPLQPEILAVHEPAPPPGPLEIPVITAQIESNGTNGIDSVWLYWRDKPYGRFSTVQMFDDGAHGDGPASDGLYGASTTNYPAGHKIHFYVEARSANPVKAAVFSPPQAEQVTYSYRVALTAATNTPVLINEFMAQNERAFADPQGDFDDWIELVNVTDREVDLTGHYLTDDSTRPQKWPFPDGTKIPANGYLLVWADENGTDTPGLHASFKLAREGEEILLIDTDADLNAVLDSVTFGPQLTDFSYGRSPADPNQFEIMNPTPLGPNASR
jgi:spore coat protein CotH